MRSSSIILGSLWLALVLLACSETEFGAGANTKGGHPGGSTEGDPSEATSDDNKGDDSSDENDKPCLDGDTINLKFPPNIQSCIDAGSIFDFDNNKCSKVLKSEWTCDWNTLNDRMADIGTSSKKVANGRDSGHKLVACGQSGSGDLIVAQWWDAKNSEVANCEFGAGNMLIVTGCYGDLPTNADTNNMSDEERQKVVSDCLKILTD